MRFVSWIASLTILSIWAALIGTVLFVMLYHPSDEPVDAKAIVILGGGAAPSGDRLVGETRDRLNAGLALYQAGAAKLVVVTGGGTPPVADHMAKALVEAGLPPEAVLIENQSHSTLQNALFTADLKRLNPADPILLVTHLYHLPRAKASFQWAGFGDVTTHAADPDAGLSIHRGLLWEAVKWPFNVLRAGGATLANVFGVPRDSYIKYLE